MTRLYRRLVRSGEQVRLNGSDGAWVRIDVLAIEGTRVHLGLASSRDYRPRLKGQRIVAGGFQIQALKLSGKQGVQLGLRFPPSFRVAPRNQPQSQEDLPAGKSDPDRASSAHARRLENRGGPESDGKEKHGEQEGRNKRSEYQEGGSEDPGRMRDGASLRELGNLLDLNKYRLR